MHDVTPGESSDWDDRPKLGILSQPSLRDEPLSHQEAPDFARLAENMAKILGLDRGRVYSIFYPDQDQTRGRPCMCAGHPTTPYRPPPSDWIYRGGAQAVEKRLGLLDDARVDGLGVGSAAWD